MTTPSIPGLDENTRAALTSQGRPTNPFTEDTSSFFGDITEAGVTFLTNVVPNSPPPMKTLVYSPDVRILIARGNKQYDVSKDVVSIGVRRVENSISTLAFKLANKPIDNNWGNRTHLRYNTLFERMDRVTCYLKRVEWIQVFSGYLDVVPHVQLFAGTVDFRASCTLKRLLYTYWDTGLPDSAQIFDQATNNLIESPNGETQLDSGLGSLMRRLLVEVAGWDQSHIHVQRFPLTYFRWMEAHIKKTNRPVKESLEQFRQILLGDDTSLGPGRAAGRATGPGISRGSYPVGPTSVAERKLQVIQCVDDMGMGPDTRDMSVSQGLGGASNLGKDREDQDAWKGQVEVGENWRDASEKNDAAVHCFMTIAVESGWMMYSNPSVPDSASFPNDGVPPNGADHLSVGLYQQQPAGWGTVAQRMNPYESTAMFLNALQGYDWRNMARGEACANVQRPRSDLRYKYALFENEAIEEVRAIRKSMGNSKPGGQQNVQAPDASVVTNVTGGNPPINPGSVTGAMPAVPSKNGNPSPDASVANSKPQYDTQGAINFARTVAAGRPYVWGGVGPSGYDCSGLTSTAYKSIGMDIGRDTTAQAARGSRINWTELRPGDLVFPHDGHVVMYTGPPNMIIEAQQSGTIISEHPSPYDFSTSNCYTFPPAAWGGPNPAAPFNPSPWTGGPLVEPNTVADGASGTTAAQGGSEPIARNLYTYMFEQGKFISGISVLYGGDEATREKAFINDEPLIHAITSVAGAGMRNFCSAPNGDFVAYYPDYFGMDGKGAQIDIEDIEMKNVQIVLNDDAIATHIYVGGSPTMYHSGGSFDAAGWMMSQGFATVENEWLFAKMQFLAPHIPGEMIYSGQQFLKKFGCRPMVQEMPSIQTGPMEFLMALHTFMTKWAEQYSTVIDLTFMPELFPGMRINLVGHELQAYCTEVLHQGDFENGFTTTATIMAPSRPVGALIGEFIKTTFDADRDSYNNLYGDASSWMF